jgi:hypothetical protein
MSPYENNALLELHAWKNPTSGWLGWVMKTAKLPLEKAGNLAMQVPGVEFVVQKTCVDLLSLINDAAQYTVRHNAIFDEFRKSGYVVHDLNDIC